MLFRIGRAGRLRRPCGGGERGELCGLQLRDIDLDRGLVRVAFNYVVRGGQRVRKGTKTHQDRWLAIDPDTCALVTTYLEEIQAELAGLGVVLREDAAPLAVVAVLGMPRLLPVAQGGEMLTVSPTLAKP